VKSFLTPMVSVLVASALLFLPAAVDGKPRVKKTVKLAAGESLVLSVEGDLSPCKQWICLVNLSPLSSRGKDLVRIKVEGDGAWVAYKAEEKDEDEDEDSKDGAEDGDDDDGEDEAAEGDDDDSADWRAKPILTLSERAEKKVKKAMGTYKVEVAEGFVWGGKYGGILLSMAGNPEEMSEQELAEHEAQKEEAMEKKKNTPPQIEIPADVLPEGSFDVRTNGYFGLSYGDTKIGSAKLSGVIRVKR